jgi:hypothetical protein
MEKTYPTNFVIVVDFDPSNNYLSDQFLLGWNNKYDWFDTDTCGWEILTKTGRVKKNNFGLIEIDRWVSVYVGEDINSCKDCSDSGNKEGYDCTVCKLEKKDDEWMLIPVCDDDDE